MKRSARVEGQTDSTVRLFVTAPKLGDKNFLVFELVFPSLPVHTGSVLLFTGAGLNRSGVSFLLMEDFRRYYYLESYLFDEIGNRFREHGDLSAFDFFLTMVWKANR